MKFSIIVPVYNVEKYLEECINSLIEQTYENYEIILIDDGSKDNSGKICDKFVEENSNISVIHQKNAGLSMARNAGILKANGDYIVFIDSDDYICDKEFLKNANQIIENKKSDFIIFGHKKFFEENGKFVEKNLFIYDNEKSIIEALIEQNYLKASACDKIVKREILIKNDIVFPKNRFSEDIEWCADLLEKSNLNSIEVLNSNVYVYRQRKNSITKSVKEKNIIDMYEMISKKYNTTKNDYIKSFLAYEYSVALGLIETTKELKNNKELKNKIYSLRNILDYDLSNKVKKVKKLVSIFGIKIASKFLGIYIYLK